MAQPLIREGVVISKKNNGWDAANPDFSRENLQVGYYHLLANDLEEAISIAKIILSLNMCHLPV